MCIRDRATSAYHCKNICPLFNPLTARIFTVFGDSLLEDRALHKEAWVAKLLVTHLSIQVHKKVKFSWQDNSSLAVKGLRSSNFIEKHKFEYEVIAWFQNNKGTWSLLAIDLQWEIQVLHYLICKIIQINNRKINFGLMEDSHISTLYRMVSRARFTIDFVHIPKFGSCSLYVCFSTLYVKINE